MAKTLAILAVILLAASGAPAQSSALKLGYVNDLKIESGRSLARNKSDEQNSRSIFLSSSDETAYINLNGRSIRLRPVSASKENRSVKVGYHSWKTYSAPGVRVRIDFTVSGVCAPNDEQCEATNYNAIMTVRRRTQRIVVKAIGLCGS